MPHASLPRRSAACLVAMLALAACSEPGSPACATQIADEVCATPAQLRGAEAVLPSPSAASVQLPAQPLAEGRYTLVSLGYTCPEGASAPAQRSVQGVLELSGCVLRRTLVAEGGEPRVEVFELGYVREGTLALQLRCAEPRELQASYGFDGERLELGRLHAEVEQSAETCATLETWELR